MKVLHEKHYEYLGRVGTWHAFRSTKEQFDPEILLLYRARMIMNDGSNKFFDPVNSTVSYHVHVDDSGHVAGIEAIGRGRRLESMSL